MAELLRSLFPLFFFAPDDGGGSGSGGDGGSGDGGDGGDGGSGGDGGDDGAGDGGDGGPASGGDKTDWQAESRKHERRWKDRDKKISELEKQLKEREDADLNDVDKAIRDAREEAAREAREAAQSDVRDDRLEAAVSRLAAGRFADIDDALLRVQAAIRRGEDLSPDDVFTDDNRVNNDVVKEYLDKLLTEKKHLATGAGTVQGDGDGGKGGDGGGKGLGEMSVEEHLKRQRGGE